MICKKCNKEIDNSKGGFITLKNGDNYHDSWCEETIDENGEVIESIIHETCYEI